MKTLIAKVLCGALLMASVPAQAFAASGGQYSAVQAELASLNQRPGSIALLSQSAGGTTAIAVPMGPEELSVLKASEIRTQVLLKQKAGQSSRCVRGCRYVGDELVCDQPCSGGYSSSSGGGGRSPAAKIVLFFAYLIVLGIVLVIPSGN